MKASMARKPDRFRGFLFCVLLLRTAWISDDAAITLRTALNFTHGYGPVFNIDERVQAYTHPLWFLLLSATSLLLGNIWVATPCLSIVITCPALVLVLLQARHNYWNLMLVATDTDLLEGIPGFLHIRPRPGLHGPGTAITGQANAKRRPIANISSVIAPMPTITGCSAIRTLAGSRANPTATVGAIARCRPICQ